jgi:hypothetical protein
MFYLLCPSAVKKKKNHVVKKKEFIFSLKKESKRQPGIVVHTYNQCREDGGKRIMSLRLTWDT